MSEAIRFDGVSYDPGGGFAIRGLDLVVPEGSIYGFLGPNGAGKTTTIRLLMGLLDPAGGRITVLGHPYPSGTVAALGGIGYVPERPHLHPFLTVGESLALHRAFHPGFDQSWADRLLDQFGVPRGRRLSRLSKGEMGKLLVLQALCQRPRLLVLDEPTDGLDPVVRRDVL
ncbi:MAG: ABC transporter ATP-binding protein, partial [Gemmatimonadales bacterium]